MHDFGAPVSQRRWVEAANVPTEAARMLASHFVGWKRTVIASVAGLWRAECRIADRSEDVGDREYRVHGLGRYVGDPPACLFCR